MQIADKSYHVVSIWLQRVTEKPQCRTASHGQDDPALQAGFWKGCIELQLYTESVSNCTCVCVIIWCMIFWAYFNSGSTEVRMFCPSMVIQEYVLRSLFGGSHPTFVLTVSTAFPSNRLGVQLALLGHCELHALECFCEPFSWRPGDPVRSAHEAKQRSNEAFTL